MPEHSKRPDADADLDGNYPPGWVPGQLPERTAAHSGHRRMIVGLVALAAVVAVTVAAVLLFTGDPPPTSAAGQPSSSPGATVPTSTSASQSSALASADDAGPVSIVTSDVTCQSWREIQSAAASAQSNGWEQRDASIPATAWTAAQRAQYEAVGTAMRTSADDAVNLARQTPHRVMRELYEQFIAYGRAYAEALPTYTEPDDMLARTNTAALQSISQICAAADSGSAIARASAVSPVSPPTVAPALGDPANPERFLAQAGPTCARWVPAESALQAGTQAWARLDADIPGDQLTGPQRAVRDGATALFAPTAEAMESAGRGSNVPAFEDFATLGALYLRAYLAGLPNSTPADRDLALVGLRLDGLIAAACQAA